jgi:RNA polymerase sigma factor (sigma-70 family)
MTALGDWSRRSDAELAVAAAQPATFAEAAAAIFERHHDAVVEICRLELREIDAVADAVQETFEELIKEFRRGRQLDNPRALGAYMRTIARRRCQRHMRGGDPGKGHRQHLDLLGLTDDVAGLETGGSTETGEDGWRDTDRRIGSARVRQVLEREIVPSLDLQQRTLFERVHTQALVGAALGKVLGLSPAQASDQLRKLRQTLHLAFLAWCLFRGPRGECPTLDRLVAAAISADGDVFTEALRTLIVRHVLSSSGADKCVVCGPAGRRLLNGWEPVLIPALLLPELRDRMERILRVALIGLGVTAAPAPTTAPPPSARRDRRRVAGFAMLIVLLLLGAAALVSGRAAEPELVVAAPAGSVTGTISGSFRHTTALIGDPDTPPDARRMTIDIAIDIAPSAFRAGDVVTLTYRLTWGFPHVDYLPGGGVTCGDFDSSGGGHFGGGIGGNPTGVTLPTLQPGQASLQLYPAQGQDPSGQPVGQPYLLIGTDEGSSDESDTLSPDGCQQTQVSVLHSRFVVPEGVPPGTYLATPFAVQLVEISGVAGAPLTPEQVDGRIESRLPLVTVN